MLKHAELQREAGEIAELVRKKEKRVELEQALGLDLEELRTHIDNFEW